MKKLFVKIFILFGLIIISGIAILLFVPSIKYITPAEYKYELLRKTNSPKLIIIGGSNAFIGIDSNKISKELNINVVNMGFTIGYGLKYMIEEIKDNIYENDKIVIIPEQTLFYEDLFTGIKESVNMQFRYRPLNIFFYFKNFKLFKHIFLENVNYSVIAILNNLQEKVPCLSYSFIRRNYNFELYNKYGDCLNFLNKKPSSILIGEDVLFLDKNFYSKEAIDYLNNFYEKMIEKNVNVIMYLSCLPDYYYLKNKSNLNELDEWLEVNIKIPKITSNEKQTYPYEYFTNSINHLNSKGRNKRTDRLINDLKLFFNLKCAHISQ